MRRVPDHLEQSLLMPFANNYFDTLHKAHWCLHHIKCWYDYWLRKIFPTKILSQHYCCCGCKIRKYNAILWVVLAVYVAIGFWNCHHKTPHPRNNAIPYYQSAVCICLPCTNLDTCCCIECNKFMLENSWSYNFVVAVDTMLIPWYDKTRLSESTILTHK